MARALEVAREIVAERLDWYAEARERLDLPDLVRLAAELFVTGSLLGRRVSAGRHTPAVPDGYTWCVIDLQGAPLALCHGPVEALQTFVWWESLEEEAMHDWLVSFRESPALGRTDSEREEDDAADRRWRLTLLGYLP